jgi:hypothetical protein
MPTLPWRVVLAHSASLQRKVVSERPSGMSQAQKPSQARAAPEGPLCDWQLSGLPPIFPMATFPSAYPLMPQQPEQGSLWDGCVPSEPAGLQVASYFTACVIQFLSPTEGPGTLELNTCVTLGWLTTGAVDTARE